MAKKILVVDDDRNIGQILYASFQSKGYETIVARNGEEALKKFNEVKPDLVLLDVLLPKMNGWEVCQRIKETDEGKHTPVILMSAIYKSYKLQADARKKYGADDFVEKPFQLTKLLEKIYAFIGEGDQLSEAEQAAEAPQEGGVAEAQPRVILEGNLEEHPFPGLLHKLYTLSRTGVLEVSYKDRIKEIAIKDGYTVSIKTNIESEFLGRYLIGIKRITQEQCEESLKRMEQTGRLQGTVLIEMGLLTPQELVRYLKLQMREKIFEVFEWPSGSYRFVEDESVVGDISNIDMSKANLIYRGIQGRYSIDRLMSLVDEYADKYMVTSSNLFYRFQDLDLSPTEAKLVRLIDGNRRIRDLLAESELDLDKTYQILYTLLITEMCEQVDAPSPSEPPLFDEADVREQEPETPPEAAPEPDESEKEEPDFVLRDSAGAGAGQEEAPEAAEEVAEETAEDESSDAELRRRILEVYERMQSDNLFRILDVSDHPTEHDVRVSYHKLAKEFHPDRFFGMISPAMKIKVEEIFRRVLEAYQALSNQSKIDEYIALLEEGEESKPDKRIEGVRQVIQAEREYQQGMMAVKQGNWEQAVESFGKAMEISSQEAEYVAYYGWSMFNLGKETSKAKTARSKGTAGDLQFQAREYLNRSIQMNPKLEKGYLFLGYVYKAQGVKDFAERQFEKALMCNPNSVEALRELRLIRLAEQRAREKSKTLVDKMKERLNKAIKRK